MGRCENRKGGMRRLGGGRTGKRGRVGKSADEDGEDGGDDGGTWRSGIELGGVRRKAESWGARWKNGGTEIELGGVRRRAEEWGEGWGNREDWHLSGRRAAEGGGVRRRAEEHGGAGTMREEWGGVGRRAKEWGRVGRSAEVRGIDIELGRVRRIGEEWGGGWWRNCGRLGSRWGECGGGRGNGETWERVGRGAGASGKLGRSGGESEEECGGMKKLGTSRSRGTSWEDCKGGRKVGEGRVEELRDRVRRGAEEAGGAGTRRKRRRKKEGGEGVPEERGEGI